FSGRWSGGPWRRRRGPHVGRGARWRVRLRQEPADCPDPECRSSWGARDGGEGAASYSRSVVGTMNQLDPRFHAPRPWATRVPRLDRYTIMCWNPDALTIRVPVTRSKLRLIQDTA